MMLQLVIMSCASPTKHSCCRLWWRAEKQCLALPWTRYGNRLCKSKLTVVLVLYVKGVGLRTQGESCALSSVLTILASMPEKACDLDAVRKEVHEPYAAHANIHFKLRCNSRWIHDSESYSDGSSHPFWIRRHQVTPSQVEAAAKPGEFVNRYRPTVSVALLSRHAGELRQEPQSLNRAIGI